MKKFLTVVLLLTLSSQADVFAGENVNVVRWSQGTVVYRNISDHYRTETGVDMYLTGPDAICVKFVWHEADQEYVLVSLEAGE